MTVALKIDPALITDLAKTVLTEVDTEIRMNITQNILKTGTDMTEVTMIMN